MISIWCGITLIYNKQKATITKTSKLKRVDRTKMSEMDGTILLRKCCGPVKLQFLK